MGEFQGISIIKKEGGTSRRSENTDSTMAIVLYSPSFPVGYTSGNPIKTIQALDIKAKGFNESFDANTQVLICHHVEEFYRICPDGELTVIVTSHTTAKSFFESGQSKGTFRNLRDIKRIGFVYNADNAGLDLEAEINASQAFINDLKKDDILIDGIYLEARGINKSPADRRTLDAPNVSLVAFQDPVIATANAKYNKYAAVGTVLGSRAVRKVNEDLGSTDILVKPEYAKGHTTFSITNQTKRIFTSVALSSGVPVFSLTQTEKNNLTSRGYIYAGMYHGLAGVFLNTEPTCVAITSDYAFGNNNGVWNKAARMIRQALLPKVKSVLKRDTKTGKLASSSVSTLEVIAEKPLRRMIADDEITGGDIYISPDQNPSDQNPLRIKGSIIKDSIVFNFEFELGLK